MSVTIAMPRMSTDPELTTAQSKYVESLARAGAEVHWVALSDPDAAAAEALTCDGLLLPGGGDMDPAFYGQERLPACGEPNLLRDAAEPKLLRAFLAADKPVLGICRGIQVMNVVLGGTLYQDIKPFEHVPHNDHWAKVHTVTVRRGTLLSQCGNLFDSLYFCEDDGTYVKIIDLMNNLGCFSVGFSNYSYIYMGKRLYMNVGIKKDFESILSILYPMNEIAAVTSEKGDGYDATSTDFKIGSMFNVVEKKIFNDADFLLCDDLGNEWADHIAIRENSMSYIHSKCNDGSATLSASKFQEVIGQAIKNIGNMNPDDNTIQEKMKGMNGKWNGTNINKCRIGMPADYERLYKKLRYNPNKVQEICLAVNYLSKSALAEAFDKIKNNQPLKQKNNVVQLVWLLSGFISTCKEADLNCRIFCKD